MGHRATVPRGREESKRESYFCTQLLPQKPHLNPLGLLFLTLNSQNERKKKKVKKK